MNDEPIKICRQCGGEYAPSAEICADCGGELIVAAKNGRDLPPLTAEEAPFLVREGSVAYLKELARELGGNQIRSAIVFHAPGPGT